LSFLPMDYENNEEIIFPNEVIGGEDKDQRVF
jgi:hypothetical protein